MEKPTHFSLENPETVAYQRFPWLNKVKFKYPGSDRFNIMRDVIIPLASVNNPQELVTTVNSVLNNHQPTVRNFTLSPTELAFIQKNITLAKIAPEANQASRNDQLTPKQVTSLDEALRGLILADQNRGGKIDEEDSQNRVVEPATLPPEPDAETASWTLETITEQTPAEAVASLVLKDQNVTIKAQSGETGWKHPSLIITGGEQSTAEPSQREQDFRFFSTLGNEPKDVLTLAKPTKIEGTQEVVTTENGNRLERLKFEVILSQVTSPQTITYHLTHRWANQQRADIMDFSISIPSYYDALHGYIRNNPAVLCEVIEKLVNQDHHKTTIYNKPVFTSKHDNQMAVFTLPFSYVPYTNQSQPNPIIYGLEPLQ